MQENIQHSVCIERKKTITVSGVESVAAFSEMKIVLILSGGERMHVVGNHLKITSFSKSNGAFTAEGEFAGVSYGGKSFVQKLFR